jgi:hypothetical protein
MSRCLTVCWAKRGVVGLVAGVATSVPRPEKLRCFASTTKLWRFVPWFLGSRAHVRGRAWGLHAASRLNRQPTVAYVYLLVFERVRRLT